MLKICAVAIVILFWWIGHRAYKVATEIDPLRSQRPHGSSLGWKIVWLLGRMPGWSCTEQEWLKWYEQYRGTINAK